MHAHVKSIRPFIGAKNFAQSRAFYNHIGFEEVTIEPKMSVFKLGAVAFYLQDYYAKDWVDNTMLFLEVDDAEEFYKQLLGLNLPAKFPGARLTPVRHETWGSECFLHDPSGILWHIGTFR